MINPRSLVAIGLLGDFGMGKRKLTNVDELELRLWHCRECRELSCEIVSYTRPVGCNAPEAKDEKSVPKWILIETLK
jgi:hypothetical protein